MARILFVEDEKVVLDNLVRFFMSRGHEAFAASTGEEALEQAHRHNPDVAVLDVMLHEGPAGADAMDGYEICRALRESGFERPVIFLTARSSEQDKLVGFELGADDYVTKPFSLPELAARVQACLKRSGGAKNVFTFDEVVIDFDVNEIRHPDRVEKLSKRERDLLEFFLYNRHRILSREELLRKVWGYKAGIATRTVDTHVLTVRKKLGDDAAQPRFVETLHGVGYQFIAKGG